MSEKAESEGKGNFWHLFGWALCWLGFGGCLFLSNRKSDAPLITITIQQTAAPVEVSK